MMEPHEEHGELKLPEEIDSISSDIESKPSYVELHSECGEDSVMDIPESVISNKTEVCYDEGLERDVAVSSASRPYNMWKKFITPLTLIAAVSGVIVAVSQYGANVREMASDNQRYQPVQNPTSTTEADNLLYIPPEMEKTRTSSNVKVNASKVSKNASRSKGSKSAPGNGVGGETEAGSLSMNMVFEDIAAPTLDIVEASSSSHLEFTANSKSGKGSKSFKPNPGDTGGEESGGSMSMSVIDIEQHIFNVNHPPTSSTHLQQHQQVVQNESKSFKIASSSKTGKATLARPTENHNEEGSDGSMSMEPKDRTLEEDNNFVVGETLDYESQLLRDAPVFNRRKYLDNHLL